MLYLMLESVSSALFTIVNTIWFVEESLIKLMMTSFFVVLQLAFHPIMLIPMFAGSYYVMRKFWSRRRTAVDGEGSGSGMRHVMRTPRVASYRSAGSLSSRSGDSCDYDAPEEEIVR